MYGWAIISGFTLIEVAISLTVLGLMLAMVTKIALPLMQQNRLAVTQQNMARIVSVLSVYAQRNNRIPCPADANAEDAAQPTGAEVGSGPDGAGVPAVDNTVGCAIGPPERPIAFNEGIVPYRTLGLNPDDVVDAQGSYITYHVNANFSRNPASAFNAHAWCRTSSWISGDINQTSLKARFCCSDMAIPNQEITVQDSKGVSLFPFKRDSANYLSVNSLYDGPALSQPSNNITTIIFVLVSHGDSGGGAFLSNGARSPATANTGAAETENMNGDNTFVWGMRSNASGDLHYDDIVMWRTQDQVYSETGGTCALP